MIKFFRRIRQNLLMENKTGKYLKYAIGEIVLVVIGILIALSINNWNEDRKYKALEIGTLIEIQKGLKQAAKENKHSENNNLVSIKSYELLIKHFENKLPYVESLNLHFANLLTFQEPDFNYSGFELFKDSGPDLISNDSIRIKLLFIYEEKIQFLVNDHYKTEWNFNNTIMTPYFTNNFEIDIQNITAIPNNYIKLMDDQQFKNNLTFLIAVRKMGVSFSAQLSLLIENLINDISIEIDKLRNI